MAIIQKTSMEEMQAFMEEYQKRFDEVVVRNLQRLGEQLIIKIRDRSGEESWYDQTGNLRSSVGYLICKDGVVEKTGGFSKVVNGTQGPIDGKNLALKAAKEAAGKYYLVIVAGMKYASVVEAMDNKDVLASAFLYAEKELPKVVKRMENLIKTLEWNDIN